MIVLMCQEQFHGKILDGSKKHTIRGNARCKPGDLLSLRKWTGRPYRSKQAVLKEVICTKVTPITITQYGIYNSGEQGYISSLEQDLLAVADGFNNFYGLADFFSKTHGLPFTGFLIGWE
jgi:hypothetical protein